jgi:flagellar motor switch protein FliN
VDTFAAALGGSEQLVLIPYDLNIGEVATGRCWQIVSMPFVEAVEIFAAPLAPPATAKAPAREAVPTVKAAPVQFDSLSEEVPAVPGPSNLDLIMDIELEIRVELGRSHLKIRDVLKLGSGSVVELDKLAGEPVDLLVNDVIFAKGEVVVIDENFGVRITDILSLADRVKTFGERKS